MTSVAPSNSSDDGEVGSGNIDSTDTAVCGSNGVSYQAICHVIPNYVSVSVLHTGRCDDINCRGGQVTDIMHNLLLQSYYKGIIIILGMWL